MRVEATDPEPDDVIQIEAAIHTTTILNFRLCNRHLTFAPFQVTRSTLNIAVKSLFEDNPWVVVWGGDMGHACRTAWLA